MQQYWTYRRFSAWALVLLFTALWSVKTAHVLLSHHHHQDEHPVCEATHDPNSAHIHDERWSVEDCSLCAFVVSVPEPFVLGILPNFLSKLPDSESPIFYHTPAFAKKGSDSVMRRGPPCG
ncbi:MAG: hypothetical protein ACKVU0_15820 [Saprospiraceae bacterium]